VKAFADFCVAVLLAAVCPGVCAATDTEATTTAETTNTDARIQSPPERFLTISM
jgi:hypothetical protein